MNRALNADSNIEIVIRGIVERVTFQNPENGYSVLQLKLAETSEQVTVVGTCPEARTGSDLIIRGTYISHPKFGRQFSALSVTETLPSTPDGIEHYLGSGLIKGIGKGTAKRLVEKFGEKTLDIIYQDPSKIAGVRGVGKAKASLIASALTEQREVREVMRFLVEHNVSPRLAGRIFEKYKNKAIEIISRDPYVLARDLRGVGFLTADRIALQIGLKTDSPQRLRAGLLHALEKSADDGHCFLEHAHLTDRTRALLELETDIDLSPHVESIIQDNFVVLEDTAIYLRQLHRAETFVADFIAARCDPLPESRVPSQQADRCLHELAREMDLTFSDEQILAVKTALTAKFMILTGGPGCGKTTITRALAEVFQAQKLRLYLAAPTGRAAQRLSSVCKYPASTIHRLLKFDPKRGGFFFGPNNPLPADVVIIDEASMLDIQLARDLCAALPKDTTLIFVGDKDQLPSVGPGRVFGDLVSLSEVTTVNLSKLYRRSEASNINDIAHQINAGSVPSIPQPDGLTKVDAYFLPKSDPEEAASTIEKLVADQIPKKFGFSLPEIVTLTPSNRGPLGTQTLNERLQNRINPAANHPIDNILSLGTIEFRVGDRVCQRVNNYNLDEVGVFNGDLATIQSIDRAKRSLQVELWDGRLITYAEGDLSQLSLAYAVSVHRAQGAEIPCVILALHDSHYALLERQLIYTAVTRAKKLLIVVGSKRALAIGCKRTSTRRRATRLRERIQNLIKLNAA